MSEDSAINFINLSEQKFEGRRMGMFTAVTQRRLAEHKKVIQKAINKKDPASTRQLKKATKDLESKQAALTKATTPEERKNLNEEVKEIQETVKGIHSTDLANREKIVESQGQEAAILSSQGMLADSELPMARVIANQQENRFKALQGMLKNATIPVQDQPGAVRALRSMPVLGDLVPRTVAGLAM
jgi:hypothetical protein